MSDTNIMLAAGPAGGKSTFIGGLYHAADKNPDITPQYNVRIGDEEEIRDNIIHRMLRTHRYPDQTTRHYAVQLKLEFDGATSPGITAEFIDIPGEQQARVLEEIKDENLKTGEVRRVYREELSDKIENGKGLSTGNDEWEKLYRYSYVKSNKVIFLLNLYKVLFDDEESIAFDAAAIEKVSHERPTAVVFTALDAVGLDPEANSPPPGSAGGSDGLLGGVLEVDLDKIWGNASSGGEIAETLRQNNQLPAGTKARNIANAIAQNDDVDVFGVSVPAEDPTVEAGNLKSDGGTGFQTRGFEDVIDWLRS